MPYAVALSTSFDHNRALDEVCSDAVRQMGGVAPELILAFYSPHHGEAAGVIASTLSNQFQGAAVVGCQGESIVAGRREIENHPALVIWLASWGGAVQIDAFHLVAERTADGPSLLGWPDALFDVDPKESAILAFGDPYTFPVSDLFLPRLNEDYPLLPVLGGMASGMTTPGENILFQGSETFNNGCVGVLLRGPMHWRPVVSQGTRAIGEPAEITEGEENVIYSIAGETPLEYMRALYPLLPARDQLLCRQGALMIGLAMDESGNEFRRGDFLIRSLHRFDENNGSLVLADRIRIGQTVQFQLRDANAADDDLRALLHRANEEGAKPAAGLLFSCNGRGMRMFPEPNHDAGAIQNEFGELPLAGFFAAGELGPVGGSNYIHGFTASVFLFE